MSDQAQKALLEIIKDSTLGKFPTNNAYIKKVLKRIIDNVEEDREELNEQLLMFYIDMISQPPSAVNIQCALCYETWDSLEGK